MRAGLLLLLMCSLVHADPAAKPAPAAKPMTVKTAKLSVDVPANYTVQVKDDTMKGESKDKEVALMVWTIDSADVPAAEKKLEGELYSAVASLKWQKPVTGKAHGLATARFDGIGHAVGGDVDILAELVGPTGGKKVLLVVLAIAHAKLDGHTAEAKKLFESVQAAK